MNEIKTEQSSLYKEAEIFFFNKIKEFDDATLIPQDINGDETQGEGAINEVFIAKDGIDDFCSKLNISQNNMFLAATSFVLSKFVNIKDLLIATITNNFVLYPLQ